MARFVLLLCCLFAFPLSVSLAAAPEQDRARLDDVLSGAGLVSDVDRLQRTYTTLHPGLYRYATPEEVRTRFDGLRRALAGGATRGETFLAFARFAATIRCGHTFPNVLNQPDALQSAILGGAQRLPFHFRWIAGRMVVTDGFGIPDLQRGADVLTIGGVPAQDMLTALLQVARADGGNDAKRIAQMQVLGYDAIEAFDVYLPLLYPRLGERPVVVWLNPDGTRIERALQGLTLAQRRAQLTNPAAASPESPAWSLDTRDPALAVLRMPTWALFNSTWDWRAFIDTSFAQLDAAGTPALVIDLRGNEGGLGVGEVLLAHLAAAPLERPRIEHRVRVRRVPDDLRAGLSTWDRSFYDWGDAATPRAGNDFHLTRWQPDTGVERIVPAAPRYTGRVFVLIGAENSSATFEFAQQAKGSGLAILVGQTTGGNQRGINGSAFFFLTLPHSGIELDLPLVGQFPLGPFPDGAPPDAGIEPDIRVQHTVQDIVEGRDAEMDAVRRALRGS